MAHLIHNVAIAAFSLLAVPLFGAPLRILQPRLRRSWTACPTRLRNCDRNLPDSTRNTGMARRINSLRWRRKPSRWRSSIRPMTTRPAFGQSAHVGGQSGITTQGIRSQVCHEVPRPKSGPARTRPDVLPVWRVRLTWTASHFQGSPGSRGDPASRLSRVACAGVA